MNRITTTDTLHLRTLSNTLGFTLVDLHTVVNAAEKCEIQNQMNPVSAILLSRAICDAENLVAELKRLQGSDTSDTDKALLTAFGFDDGDTNDSTPDVDSDMNGVKATDSMFNDTMNGGYNPFAEGL